MIISVDVVCCWAATKLGLPRYAPKPASPAGAIAKAAKSHKTSYVGSAQVCGSCLPYTVQRYMYTYIYRHRGNVRSGWSCVWFKLGVAQRQEITIFWLGNCFFGWSIKGGLSGVVKTDLHNIHQLPSSHGCCGHDLLEYTILGGNCL